MKTLAFGKSWSASDTTIYAPVPSHLGKWLVQTLLKNYRGKIVARAQGYSTK